MSADVRQSQGARVVDQDAQHTAAAGTIAYLPLRAGVDTERDETLERPAILRKHADRRVARTGEVRRGFERRAQDRLEIEVGNQHAAHVEQPAEPRDIESGLSHAAR